MTEHRSLKRLVRERMARTGESYTTAHRHVTRRRAPVADIPGVVPGYPGFGFGEHRPSGLVRQLLAAAGVPVSEAMACGLGGGIGFLYAVFDYRSVGHPLLTVVAQHHPQPWLEAVAAAGALEVRTVHSSTPARALAKLDEALSQGVPVLLRVRRGGLPNQPDDDPMAAADAYDIVVAGRHDEHYLVDDGASEPLRLNASELAQAWAGHRKGRFSMQRLVPPTGQVDLARACSRAVETTVAHLTGPVLGNAFDANMGLAGMAKLAAELRATNRTGWAHRFAGWEPYALHRLSECLTWAYTAPGGTRPVYAEFLSEAAALLPDRADRLTAASRMFAAAGRGWVAAADAAAAAAAGPEPARTFAELADQVDACRDLERQAVGLLSGDQR